MNKLKLLVPIFTGTLLASCFPFDDDIVISNSSGGAATGQYFGSSEFFCGDGNSCEAGGGGGQAATIITDDGYISLMDFDYGQPPTMELVGTVNTGNLVSMEGLTEDAFYDLLDTYSENTAQMLAYCADGPLASFAILDGSADYYEYGKYDEGDTALEGAICLYEEDEPGEVSLKLLQVVAVLDNGTGQYFTQEGVFLPIAGGEEPIPVEAWGDDFPPYYYVGNEGWSAHLEYMGNPEEGVYIDFNASLEGGQVSCQTTATEVAPEEFLVDGTIRSAGHAEYRIAGTMDCNYPNPDYDVQVEGSEEFLNDIFAYTGAIALQEPEVDSFVMEILTTIQVPALDVSVYDYMQYDD